MVLLAFVKTSEEKKFYCAIKNFRYTRAFVNDFKGLEFKDKRGFLAASASGYAINYNKFLKLVYVSLYDDRALGKKKR